MESFQSAKIKEEEFGFIKSNVQLVHSVQVDARELTNLVLKVPKVLNPKVTNDLAIAGRVDFLIETKALWHSVIPDIDLPLLGAVMRKGIGTMLLSSTRAYRHSTLNELYDEGYDFLKQMGLKPVFGFEKKSEINYRCLSFDPKVVLDPQPYHLP